MNRFVLAALLALVPVVSVSPALAQGRVNLPAWTDTALATAPSRLPLVTTNEERIAIGRDDAGVLPLGSGTRGIVRVNMASPVDVFVVSADQLDSTHRAMRGDSTVALNVLELKRSVTRATIDWTAPDRRLYFLFIENARYPAGGARPRGRVEGTVQTFGLVPPPAAPMPGRGLLLGRFTVRVMGARGRETAYRGPQRLRLRHVPMDADRDTAARLTFLETDDNGYFYFSNVPARRAWWIEGVDGVGFRAMLTETAVFADGGWRLPLTAGFHETGYPESASVADLGECVVTVDTVANRLVRAEYRTPFARVTTGAGRLGGWRTVPDNRTPLARHAWFLDYFGALPWGDAVRRHRDYLQNARTSARRPR